MGAKGVDKHKAIMAESRIVIVWNLPMGLEVYNINLLNVVYESMNYFKLSKYFKFNQLTDTLIVYVI